MVHEPEDGGRGEAAQVGAGQLQLEARRGGEAEAGGRDHGAVNPDQGRARGI